MQYNIFCDSVQFLISDKFRDTLVTFKINSDVKSYNVYQVSIALVSDKMQRNSAIK